MKPLWIGKDAGIGERAIACGAGPSGQRSLARVVRLAAHRHLVVHAVMALIFCFAAGALEPARAQQSWANVDAARVEAAVQDGANWMTYGRTYSEQRFSPLTQINADNANQLGLVGYTDLDVIDGKPLRYKPETDGGYVLYSIGWDQKDDGGEIAWTRQGKGTGVDIGKGDWVWLMPTARE